MTIVKDFYKYIFTCSNCRDRQDRLIPFGTSVHDYEKDRTVVEAKCTNCGCPGYLVSYENG